jgi:methylenetetrahydrofolate reductase (NADPH)
MKISYEFYPPKDLDYKKVVNEFALISKYKPRFISITYGAMGSSQEKSSGLIKEFKRETNVEVIAHLTLVGKSKSDLKRIIDEFKSLGVQKIVALRGDSPEGKFQAHPDGFYNTSDFVKFLCENDLEVFVSAYPEPHPDSKGFDFDLKLLKEKTSAGSHHCITQFCFSMPDYRKLVSYISKEKIQNELTAGIMPIYDINSLCNMAKRCGINIPKDIIKQFSSSAKQNERAAIDICIKQIESLQNMGINNFHFYTLNRSSLLTKIFDEVQTIN